MNNDFLSDLGFLSKIYDKPRRWIVVQNDNKRVGLVGGGASYTEKEIEESFYLLKLTHTYISEEEAESWHLNSLPISIYK